MLGFLLDTNHLSHAIHKISPLRDRLREAHRHGHRLGTCWPVLCELEAGLVQTRNPEGYRRNLRTLLKEVRIWPTVWDIVRLYGEIHKSTRQKGRSLSHVDLVLAAQAHHLHLTLLTTDRDFEAVPEIQVDNWIP